MIVCCPGCSTHFSHTEEDRFRMGRCSQCDERFPLTLPKRKYVVMSSGTTTVDPLLAAGLAAGKSRVDIPGPPGPAQRPADYGSSELDGGDDSGFFSSDIDDDEALFGMDDEPRPEAAEAAGKQAGSERKRPTHVVRELLGVFLLAGLGAAAGYQGSLQFGFEPVKAIGVGLVAGISFAWAWIRWAERKR